MLNVKLKVYQMNNFGQYFLIYLNIKGNQKLYVGFDGL